jgi:hypothetical protein
MTRCDVTTLMRSPPASPSARRLGGFRPKVDPGKGYRFQHCELLKTTLRIVSFAHIQNGAVSQNVRRFNPAFIASIFVTSNFPTLRQNRPVAATLVQKSALSALGGLASLSE